MGIELYVSFFLHLRNKLHKVLNLSPLLLYQDVLKGERAMAILDPMELQRTFTVGV